MRKEKGVQTAIMILLAVAVVAMSVGFAAFASNLVIGGSGNNGQVTVKQAKWDIHFVDDETTDPVAATITKSNNSVTGTAEVVSDTSVTFTTTLNKPGDFFQFTVDVTNAGTFNANLYSVLLTGPTAAQAKYLDFTVTYDGQSYPGGSVPRTYGTAIQPTTQSTLNPNATKTATVRLEYVQPASESDLPSSGDVTVSCTATLNYRQADDSQNTIDTN